jgi:phosphatidylserine synthase
LYGGEVYEGGVDYRLDQLKIILIRFQQFPILGVGFGYFTPGYLTYEFLPKPYLLELDLLNFISKIGFLFFIIYILSYLFIYKLINKINDKLKKETYLSFFIGLLSLLLYSIGQTLHQSYLYWVSFSILYACIIIEMRKQNIKYV